MKPYTLILPDNYIRQPLPSPVEWIPALRSAQYSQTNGALCNIRGFQHEYCCLGLLSKLQGRLDASLYDNGESAYYVGYSNPLFPVLTNNGTFPEGVKVELGNNNPPALSLASCNDAYLTFPQIADIIEAVWYNPLLCPIAL